MRVNRCVPIAAALAALMTGSAFAALAPETKLAGITVGQKGIVVIRHFGNPSNVTPGLGDASTSAAAGPGAGPVTSPYALGPGGLPPGIPPLPGGIPQGIPPGQRRYPGSPPSTPYGPGALPPVGADNSGSALDSSQDVTGLTTWNYKKLSGGPMIDFRLNEDGTVVEIVATGLNPSPTVRTARGVTLGDPYGKVLKLYGFPEDASQQGNIMTIKYVKSGHCAFQFYKLRVVRIAVAQPKKALGEPS